MRNRYFGRLAFVFGLAAAVPAFAADVPAAMPDDNLNAVLWDQTSVEAQANALGALDQALNRSEVIFLRPVGVGHVVAESAAGGLAAVDGGAHGGCRLLGQDQ